MSTGHQKVILELKCFFFLEGLILLFCFYLNHCVSDVFRQKSLELNMIFFDCFKCRNCLIYRNNKYLFELDFFFYIPCPYGKWMIVALFILSHSLFCHQFTQDCYVGYLLFIFVRFVSNVSCGCRILQAFFYLCLSEISTVSF